MAKSVSILPNLSSEQAATVQKLIEQKQNLEYGALMMLKDLHRMGLLRILQSAVKREQIDEEQLADFYGDGHPINGLTVSQLIEQWEDTTDKMLSTIAGR